MTRAIFIVLVFTAASARAEPVRFNRDVRPILAEHCWQCHGPDKATRQAGLRLDVRERALQPADSGNAAIIPGDPRRSELVQRIMAADVDTRMPPHDLNKPLSEKQIATLRDWIAQGAKYQRHWSFRPLSRPVVPASMGDAANPIDAFVGAKLRKHGKSFAPRTSREKLLRRVSLTLTGLPPTLADLDRTAESYSQAIDRLLASPHYGEHMAAPWLDTARYADTNGYFADKPRQMWLWRDWVIDAFNRNMPFDQFTIEQLAGDLLPNATIRQRIATGFNRNNMANNETGIIDEEYRVQYVVDRVDTTVTTWLALTAGCSQCHDHKYDPISQREFYGLFAFFNNVPEQGLITADNPPPLITVTTPRQHRRLIELRKVATASREAFEQLRPQLETKVAKWEALLSSRLDASDGHRKRSQPEPQLPSPPSEFVALHESFDGRFGEGMRAIGTAIRFESGIRGQAARFDATGHFERSLPSFDADAKWTAGFWVKPDGALSCLLSKIEPFGRRRGFELLLQKGRIIVNVVHRWGADSIEVATRESIASRKWHHVTVRYDGSRKARGLTVSIDGKPADLVVRRDRLSGGIANDEPLRIGRRDAGLGYYGAMDELRIITRALTDDTVANWFRGERLRRIFETPPESRTQLDRDFLLDDYLRGCGDCTAKRARRNMLHTRQAEEEFRATIPTTLVMRELPEPRRTHVLIRGQYDQPGEFVTPDVPAILPPLPKDSSRNRLSFANWLMSDHNPLTARVAVNRLWQQCFGEGLVRTMNDFGTQGEPPTHPELFDWLACELRDSGWDIKRTLRLIVMSRTYQQDSRFRDESAFEPRNRSHRHQAEGQRKATRAVDPLDREFQATTTPRAGKLKYSDPENRLLGRGPNFRLTSEMIRDLALAVSGLLEQEIGGPSVKPYQPPGLWAEVSYNASTRYVPDTGPSLWRRTTYTYMKRQSPPPAFLIFDGVTREKCTIERARTNTPLQSLVLLNDPTYVEAARALAALTIAEKADDAARLKQLFRRVLARAPEEDETRMLIGLLERQRRKYAASPQAAARLISNAGKAKPPLVPRKNRSVVEPNETNTEVRLPTLPSIGQARGSWTPAEHLDRGEQAAWTVVTQTVLNLDEAIHQR